MTGSRSTKFVNSEETERFFSYYLSSNRFCIRSSEYPVVDVKAMEKVLRVLVTVAQESYGASTD